MTLLINLRLLEQYNAGIQRSMDAYWYLTSPIAEHDRKVALAERKAREQRRHREKVRNGRAA